MPIADSTIKIQPESRAEWNGVVAILQRYGYHWARQDPGPIETSFNKSKRFRHITAYGKTSGGMAGELTHGEYVNPPPPEGKKTPGGANDTPGDCIQTIIEASAFLANYRLVLCHYSLPQVSRSRISFDKLIESQADKWR
jgi:hypothetical protein